MAQNIQLFGPRVGFLTHQWIITGNKYITDKCYDETKMRTRQKRVKPRYESTCRNDVLFGLANAFGCHDAIILLQYESLDTASDNSDMEVVRYEQTKLYMYRYFVR